MPIVWNSDVSVEDIVQFDHYKDRLNLTDCDLMVCMDYIEQLRFDGYEKYPSVVSDYLNRCYDILSGCAVRDGLYYLSLYDFSFKWVLRALVSDEKRSKRYNIKDIEDMNNRFMEYKAKWHNIYSFRDFLIGYMSKASYKKLISDANDYYASHSGFFDPVFSVGGAIALFDDMTLPCFLQPDGHKEWRLFGEKLNKYFNTLAYQAGFELYKNRLLDVLNTVGGVSFELDKDYEFPIVSHLNWR